MTKEILLYSNINSYTAGEFITAMNEAADSDICLRINSDGGSPDFGFGMIAKFKEHAGSKAIKVDGKAHSMTAFFLCYADDTEALEMAEFTVHRAAYPSWYESNPDYFTEDVKANVERVNVFLKKAFEAKIDVAKFEALKGVKVKDIFSMDSRIEVTLTAAEAKKIGLINRVIKITPEKTAEVNSLIATLTASTLKNVRLAAEITTEIKTPKHMNLAEFKTAHPAVYAEAVAAGVAQEKDRVESILVFMEADAAGVKAAIEAGKPLSAKQTSEFVLKATSVTKLEAVAGDSAAPVKTAEVLEKEKTEKEAKVASFAASLDGRLGLTAAK